MYCSCQGSLGTVSRLGGYSGFQVIGMIKWGQKSKPKKIPGPKFNPPLPPQKKSHAEFPNRKNFQKTLWCNKEKNANISFEYPKKSVLNQATPEKSFDHPCHVQSKVPPEVSQSSQPWFLCVKSQVSVLQRGTDKSLIVPLSSN